MYEATRRSNLAPTSRVYYDEWCQKKASGEVPQYEEPYRPPPSVTRQVGRPLTDAEDAFRRSCDEVVGPDFVPHHVSQQQQQQQQQQLQQQIELDWAQPPEEMQRPTRRRFPNVNPTDARPRSAPVQRPTTTYLSRDGRDPTTWSFSDPTSVARPPPSNRIVEFASNPEEDHRSGTFITINRQTGERAEEEEEDVRVYYGNEDHDGYSDDD